MNIDIAEQIIATLHTRIDELVAERDEMRRKWLLGHELVTQFAQKSIAITKERDALAAAAKLALAYVKWMAYFRRDDEEPIPTAAEVSEALKKAGVQ